MKFQSGIYHMIEVFSMSNEGKEGKVLLIDSQGKTVEELAGNGYHRWIKLPLAEDQEYTLEMEHCDAPLIYLSECEDILEKGICYLNEQVEGNCLTNDKLARWYDTPYREQYHFNPYQGWINDPNGLCYFKGYYHLYYQYNPFGQEWNNMYWGHAASKDLMHWVHLPVCLEPQEELRGNTQAKGGAFSGSAVVSGDEILFYLTRHFGPLEDGPETIEYQTFTRSRDSIHFEPEQVIVERPGPEVSYNFRDPKLFFYGGKWNMVLGSAVSGVPALVNFTSENGIDGWEYQGPILTDSRGGIETIECPDFFELDGKYVAVGDLMWYHDAYGRYQPLWYYIGNYQDGKLQVEQDGLLDFGTNFYAVQSFEHEGRRIAIGWISDFYSEHQILEPGAYGSMSLPRELHLKNGKLTMLPVQEAYALKGEALASVKQQGLHLEQVPGNSYYVKLCMERQTDFELVLAQQPGASLRFVYQNGVAEIKTAGVATESVRFPADVSAICTAEIFVDRRTVEIFLNDGEAAGAKVFYLDSADGSFSAEFADAAAVSELSVHRMNSVWGK
ncbi:Beta-fructosidase [uncultured Ruminococcus sp.]|uniref:glycoside hydrolase family 32 protein n=1 Tax=Massiliimalia timonensis TaxID=1987501 RepID=UPI0008233234|nr:glycoside hydrolase family 32 protein [Massiliimalia timonensis]SCI08701.1 Beta-fructosidase [uncultured Clostridium sp.]SCI35519.1 Beta-fructosidase [uncultured Ruminococcus sp.]